MNTRTIILAFLVIVAWGARGGTPSGTSTHANDTANTSTTATTGTTKTDTTTTTTGTPGAAVTTDTTITTGTEPTGTPGTTPTTSTADGNKGSSTQPWLLNTLLALMALVLIAIAAAITRLIRRMSAPTPKFEQTELARRLDKLTQHVDASFGVLTDRMQKQSQDHAAQFAALPTAEQIHKKLVVLRQDIAGVKEAVDRISTTPPPSPAPATDQVSLERQILGETWKQFRANKELLTAFESAMHDSAWEPLITELAKVVPDDLKPTFEAVIAPWREHRMLIHKISLVPRIVSGELKRLDNEAEELRRTREYAALLASAQSSTDSAARLHFRFKQWVTETFLSFADLYLQRQQQSRLEKSSDELEAGARIVRQVLGIAAVEPIDVTLGETPFDSARHIGRSTTNDPRFSDGVITGVVRNGFIERGQQVIRQPEVIVNRR